MAHTAGSVAAHGAARDERTSLATQKRLRRLILRQQTLNRGNTNLTSVAETDEPGYTRPEHSTSSANVHPVVQVSVDHRLAILKPAKPEQP